MAKEIVSCCSRTSCARVSFETKEVVQLATIEALIREGFTVRAGEVVAGETSTWKRKTKIIEVMEKLAKGRTQSSWT